MDTSATSLLYVGAMFDSIEALSLKACAGSTQSTKLLITKSTGQASLITPSFVKPKGVLGIYMVRQSVEPPSAVLKRTTTSILALASITLVIHRQLAVTLPAILLKSSKNNPHIVLSTLPKTSIVTLVSKSATPKLLKHE